MITEANKNVILRLTIPLITPFCDETSQKQEGNQIRNDLLREFFHTIQLPATHNQRQGNLFFYNLGNFILPLQPFLFKYPYSAFHQTCYLISDQQESAGELIK